MLRAHRNRESFSCSSCWRADLCHRRHEEYFLKVHCLSIHQETFQASKPLSFTSRWQRRKSSSLLSRRQRPRVHAQLHVRTPTPTVCVHGSADAEEAQAKKPVAEMPPTKALNDAEVLCSERARKDFLQHNSRPFKAKKLARKPRISLQSHHHWRQVINAKGVFLGYEAEAGSPPLLLPLKCYILSFVRQTSLPNRENDRSAARCFPEKLFCRWVSAFFMAAVLCRWDF